MLNFSATRFYGVKDVVEAASSIFEKTVEYDEGILHKVVAKVTFLVNSNPCEAWFEFLFSRDLAVQSLSELFARYKPEDIEFAFPKNWVNALSDDGDFADAGYINLRSAKARLTSWLNCKAPKGE